MGIWTALGLALVAVAITVWRVTRVTRFWPDPAKPYELVVVGIAVQRQLEDGEDPAALRRLRAYGYTTDGVRIFVDANMPEHSALVRSPSPR